MPVHGDVSAQGLGEQGERPADAVGDLLEAATTRLDGKRSATSTVLRNKTILQNAPDYAVELSS
ncbi:hypothetical protein [Streptosporangium carneum]|uniref:Uncharacterized protein n=1 Tax=Streptosporangium carneum TaxID=47481 RepID=A0A9W6MDE0_9ACTN|nr:hypothetical protein [Streptosporangium carneum]GLK09688.1 hypothetical protein GCM10017600_30940 [Streptosporangium carneum]